MYDKRCRVCDCDIPAPASSRATRFVCCDGADCACRGETLPADICSLKCFEDEVDGDEETFELGVGFEEDY